MRTFTYGIFVLSMAAVLSVTAMRGMDVIMLNTADGGSLPETRILVARIFRRSAGGPCLTKPVTACQRAAGRVKATALSAISPRT